MGRKVKKATALPPDVSGVPDFNGEVNMYNKAITDKMLVQLADELIIYENKEQITLLCAHTDAPHPAHVLSEVEEDHVSCRSGFLDVTINSIYPKVMRTAWPTSFSS